MFSASLIILLVSCAVLCYVFFNYKKLSNFECDNEEMVSISKKISDGASLFLRCLYKYLVFFVLVVSIVIMFVGSTKTGSQFINKYGSICFIFGSLLSMLAGFIAMKISTKSNILVAIKSKNSIKDGFNTSFNSGSLIGMTIVGFGILGLALIFFSNSVLGSKIDFFFCTNIVLFALGVESVALFSRVAGGIFTKAADIGADLVGKLEENIPEDDSRNPAVIADNVGDNVGDIAGMGSDLLGSFVSAIVGCIFLFFILFTPGDIIFSSNILMFPLLFCFCGSLASIIVSKIIVHVKNDEFGAIFRNGVIAVTFVNAVIGLILVFNMFPSRVCLFNGLCFTNAHMRAFFCLLIGLFISLLVSFFTKFYTDSEYSPLKYIIKQSNVGPSTNIIGGLCVGMESLFFPVLFYSFGTLLTYNVFGFLGISLSAVGVISTAMIQLSIDAFGPIADNAGGIVEMSKSGVAARKNTDVLDVLGNTTAATGKSFSVTSAVFTFFSLFVCILSILNVKYLSGDIYIVSGLLFGAMIPYLFSSMVIRSVGSAAMKIIDEVRRQFSSKKKKNEEIEPDYDKCISISTVSSVKGMYKPAILVIFVPILILLLFNVNMCIGFLVGLFLSSVLLGIFHSNVGGAWDNAKKAFEKGVDIDGVEYSKKSVSGYKSAVIGDTVGDPLKDTSGPSMNIVLKITSFIFVVFGPLFLRFSNSRNDFSSRIDDNIFEMSNFSDSVIDRSNYKKSRSKKSVKKDKSFDESYEDFFDSFFDSGFSDKNSNRYKSKKSVKKDKSFDESYDDFFDSFFDSGFSSENSKKSKFKKSVSSKKSFEDNDNDIVNSLIGNDFSGIARDFSEINNSAFSSDNKSTKKSINKRVLLNEGRGVKLNKNVSSSVEPKVYVNEDKNGNYEKLTEYPNGYVYESYYSNN